MPTKTEMSDLEAELTRELEALRDLKHIAGLHTQSMEYLLKSAQGMLSLIEIEEVVLEEKLAAVKRAAFALN